MGRRQKQNGAARALPRIIWEAGQNAYCTKVCETPEDVVEMSHAWPREREREFPEVLRELLEEATRMLKEHQPE
jgi:hypothetical protein